MNDVLQCLISEPVPDLLRLSGLLALPIVLRLALLRVRRHGLGLVEPERQLPFFDGIPSAGQQAQGEKTGSAVHPRARDAATPYQAQAVRGGLTGPTTLPAPLRARGAPPHG